MAKRRIVVALGGNAILSKDASAEAQQQALRDTAKYLVQFIKQGDDLIVSHGNGPVSYTHLTLPTNSLV